MTSDYDIGDHVLVIRDPGLEPAEAEILANSDDRPHLVKVKYLRSRPAHGSHGRGSSAR